MTTTASPRSATRLATSPVVAAVVLALLAVMLPATTVTAATSYDLEARYHVDLHLDWDTRWVKVRTAIDVRNTTSRAIHRLELNTVAAKLGNLRKLKASAGGSTVPARVKGQTIKVPLGTALAPGEQTRVWVSFKARLRTTTGGRSYFFTKVNGVAQLYRFIPWVSRQIPFGSGNHGEPFVTPVSPYVEVIASSDRKLNWATTGWKVKRLGARTWRFVATGVRDFDVAASPHWRTVAGKSADGKVRITAHTRRHDGERLIRLAREELTRYRKKTGVAYPHPTFRIAETGGGLAMEAPALIWIPAARPARDHAYLVSHEVAHQWWYSTVGNDQSTDAFADEALADYHARKAHLSIRASRCKMDRLDREIRAYTDVCYFEVIYIQGARFLDNLRKDYGGAKFKAALKAYTKDNRDGISNNARLLAAFHKTMGDGVLKRFHKRFPSLY